MWDLQSGECLITHKISCSVVCLSEISGRGAFVAGLENGDVIIEKLYN